MSKLGMMTEEAAVLFRWYISNKHDARFVDDDGDFEIQVPIHYQFDW